LDTLILDLRNNIGGSIDILPYFLGPFIGQDQYAYEFLHQGERTPFKTKVGWLNSLVPYKKVIILINNQSQSTAELMASVLKRYNVGVLVGERTKGWGTIERVFELENQISPGEKYSMFLVHTLTLRDDNQPIEGNGVEPVISINSSNWKQQLLSYFDNQTIVKTVEQIWSTDPNSFY
jgi:C-terminal processing protease CtpA/Prc